MLRKTKPFIAVYDFKLFIIFYGVINFLWAMCKFAAKLFIYAAFATIEH
jgi:hypothetical protein